MITVFYVSYDAPREVRSALGGLGRGDTNISEVVRDAVRQGHYLPVAEIEGDNIEHAWTMMQNGVMTESWTMAPPKGLRPLAAPLVENGKTYGHRSADLGDVFVVDGKAFVCLPVGFGEVPGLTTMVMLTLKA
jgi:hypothetical protein